MPQPRDTDAKQQEKLVREARRGLREVASAFQEARANEDAETLDAMIAEEYVLIDPGGNIVDKKQMIADLTKRRLDFINYKTKQPITRVYGDVAFEISLFEMAGTMQVKPKTKAVAERVKVLPKDVSGVYRQTNTFHKRDDRWILISTQITKDP
jgi:ketosteroid isomerase-like protein